MDNMLMTLLCDLNNTEVIINLPFSVNIKGRQLCSLAGKKSLLNASITNSAAAFGTKAACAFLSDFYFGLVRPEWMCVE